MDTWSQSRPLNHTFTVEDMMDYTGGDEDDTVGWAGHQRDDPLLFDTKDMYDSQDLYNGLFGGSGGSFNLSGLSLEDLGGDFVLGGEVSGLMLGYMKHRPYVLGTLLVLTTIIGVCANLTLLVVLVRRGWEALSFTSILLLNLTAACLLFLLGGMPLLLVENVFGYGWRLGVVLCQLHRYIIYVSFFCISYSVVGLLLHQTLALYMPDRMSRLDAPGYALTACGALWVVILTANVPNYLGHGITDEIAGVSYCFNKELQSDLGRMQAWTLIHFVFSFAVPFLLLCLCSVATIVRLCTAPHCEYNRLRETPSERRYYATLAVIVTLTFALCWAPDKIFSLMLVLNPRHMDVPSLIASDVMMVLAYTNPAINPFIILLSGLREVKRSGTTGLGVVAVKRTITEHINGKQDNSTSLPLCAQEDVVDPEMITTV